MNVCWKMLPTREFYKFSDQWDALNLATVNQQITGAPFVSLAIKHFMTGDEVYIVGFKDDLVVAAGIFSKTNMFRWSTVQPSQAPLGLWLCRSEYFTPDVLLSLSRALPGPAWMIDLLQLDSAAYQKLQSRNFNYSEYISTSALPIPEDFAAYFASLGKNMRQNFNKLKNRLSKNDNKIDFVILRDPLAMDTATRKFGEIESKGWKAKTGTAVNADNQQGKFYAELMMSFAEQNQAEIWQYSFDENIVAVDLCIKQDATLIILKTTFDESQSKYSPSLLMKLDAIQQTSAEREITKIEFFGKTMQWHQRLNSVERGIFHLTWARYPTIFSLLSWLKKMLQKK